MTELGVGIQTVGVMPGTLAFEAQIGRTVNATRHYRSFDDTIVGVPVQESIAGGRTPLISWHAFNNSIFQGVTNKVDARWADITAGVHDAVIIARAEELKSLGTAKVRFVFHHEPEDDVDGWPAGQGQGRCGTPAEFAPAWMHVRDVMKANGVGANVRFGVCLMGSTYRGGHGGAAVWIPATLVPDFIATDGYTRDAGAGQKWTSFVQVYGAAHDFAVSRGRPLVIEESGVAEGVTPDLKPAWYDGAAATLAVWQPELYMYSNVYAQNFGGQDYRVDTTPESLAAFKRLVASLTPPKPLVAGLMNRNVPVATSPYPPNIELRWDEMQPSAGTLVTPAIDAALETGKPFSVRPMLGRYAPAWLTASVGTFTYTEPQSGAFAPMLRWWTPTAIAATAELYRLLAERYDGKLSLIWNSVGMTWYAEPLQRGLGSAGTRAELAAAGYTVDLDLAALRAGIDGTTAFKTTRIGMAFNPFQHLDPTASRGFTPDPATTGDLMDYFRAKLGASCVLGNNSLRSGFLANISTANGGVYAQILNRGKPFRFQTATLDRVGDLNACLIWAGTAGAHAVELPAGQQLTAFALANADAALKANAP